MSGYTVDPHLADTVLSFAAYTRKLMVPAIVYRFFDADGQLLYVGITSRGVARWTVHAAKAVWWPLVASATVVHYESVFAASAAEARAIRTERPIYNVMGRPRD